MNEEINELLSQYKIEKARIDSLIKEDIIDRDYLAANLNSRNLRKIQRQINLIEFLLNPHTQEKERLKRTIDFFVERSKLEEADDYKNEMWAQIDRKLDQLNSYRPAYFNDGQEFDDAIFDLVENKIKGFIFTLKKAKNLVLLFNRNDKQLLLSITGVKKLKKEYILPKEIRKSLKIIGFKKEKHLDSLVFTYDLNLFKDSIYIKTITSRVIFDVFDYQDLDKNTTIEIL